MDYNGYFQQSSRPCLCQAEAFNTGQAPGAETSADCSDDTFFTPYEGLPLHIPIDPLLFDDSEQPLLQMHSTSLSQDLTLPEPHHLPLWIQRLEKLEIAVEQLQDPASLRQQPPLARLDDIEKLIEGMRSKMKSIQDAISDLEKWAELMNGAYKEFKKAVYDVYKLVNSRQHLLNLLNLSVPQADAIVSPPPCPNNQIMSD